MPGWQLNRFIPLIFEIKVKFHCSSTAIRNRMWNAFVRLCDLVMSYKFMLKFVHSMQFTSLAIINVNFHAMCLPYSNIEVVVCYFTTEELIFYSICFIQFQCILRFWVRIQFWNWIWPVHSIESCNIPIQPHNF